MKVLFCFPGTDSEAIHIEKAVYTLNLRVLNHIQFSFSLILQKIYRIYTRDLAWMHKTSKLQLSEAAELNMDGHDLRFISHSLLQLETGAKLLKLELFSGNSSFL